MLVDTNPIRCCLSIISGGSSSSSESEDVEGLPCGGSSLGLGGITVGFTVAIAFPVDFNFSPSS
jgi:hypothetical protein